jgi:2,3-diketo-5-methylthio-1-phosphopentane phosphatase
MAATDPQHGSWTILCDFDGTITLEDVTDGLLERYAQPGWKALEDEWCAGRIGSRECMQRQIALLDVSTQELERYLDTVQIDPDFGAFVHAAQRRGYPVSIVSDGLDYVIRHILQRHRLPQLPVAANRLLAAELPQRWRLVSPHEVAGCQSGTCKCAPVRRARTHPGTRVLLIGDGRSDFCATGVVDLVFAKSGLIELCRSSARPHQPVAGFRTALELLPRLDSLVAPTRDPGVSPWWLPHEVNP